MSLVAFLGSWVGSPAKRSVNALANQIERRTPSASTFVSSSRANSFVERMSGSLREGSIGRLLMPPATPPAPWPDDSPCGIWTRKPTNKPP